MSGHDFQNPGVRIVLASASPYRLTLLENAGLEVTAITAGIDEDAVKAALPGSDELSCEDVAEVLAHAKAINVSEREPDAFVIGADQTLDDRGLLVSKAKSEAEARARLLAMRGRSHALHSAVCLAREGEVIWSHVESAELTVRDFSPEWLGRYMASAGTAILKTVGGYEYESTGIQLFDRIDGDYHTILGLPLLPLLAELRRQGALLS